jgi:hypothetical protein
MKFPGTKKQHPQPSLTRTEALNCIPLINSSVSSSESASGEIVLQYPLQLKPFFVSLFRRFQQADDRPTRRLELDEMGSVVWKSIDGRNSVQAIIGSFADRYNLTLPEAERSVTAFLVELGKRGIIALR